MSRDTSDSGDEERNVATSRRRFLEAAGAAGLVGTVGGGFAVAQQDGPTTYRFGGEVAGWQGRAPSAIEGQVNPTMQLEAGTEYEVVWENIDGLPHDFVIQDDQGERITGTEIMSEEGATRSFTFTASEEMARYICTVHPTSMVGDVEVGGGGATATEQGTAQQQERFVPEGPTVGAREVADGPLVNPVNLRTVPGMENTHAIVDQPGQIYLLQDGELRSEPVLDLSDRVMILAPTDGNYDRSEGFDERGLLGMDFHPDFQENGRIFVRYSSAEPSGDTLVGPGDREFPDGWDHVAVLSEFQASMGGTGTATADGTESGNATQGGNATQAGNDTQMAAGNGTQMGAGTGMGVSIDPDSERVLLEVPEPQFNHNGGEVTFGPDGYLYTSLGDGGGANDDYVGHAEDWYDGNEGGNGQNVTENLLGAILRIDVDQEGENTPYAVPDDNPLVGTEGMDEIYAWGLRNPWRMSFNDGQLITADVGQSLFEEVDVVESGGNYGWNVREGFHCFNAADATSVPEQCPTNAPDQPPFNGQPLRDPVAEYPHTYQGDGVGISITAGYTYQGDQIQELSGQYVFGDWSVNFVEPQGRVFVAQPNQQGTGTATDDGMAANGTGNATGGNDTGTEIGNVSVGQEAAGAANETNGTTGNESERTATEAPTQGDIDVRLPSEQPWSFSEVMFENAEGQQLNRFIQAFGRDSDGNVYVLASTTGRLSAEDGQVYQLVPAGEGDELSQPQTATPTEGAAGGGNETGNETTTEMTGEGGNETGGNQSGN